MNTLSIMEHFNVMEHAGPGSGNVQFMLSRYTLETQPQEPVRDKSRSRSIENCHDECRVGLFSLPDTHRR